MEFSNIVLLYSKYSPNSKKMLDILQNSKIDLRVLSIQTVCIDNENIRKRIYGSSIEVKTVPTILVLYPDGGVEKFDGGHSFEFIQNVIQNYIQMNTPPQAPQVQQPPPQAQQPPPQAPIQQQKNQQQRQPQKNKTKASQNKSFSNKTSIDDLLDEDEEEEPVEEQEEPVEEQEGFDDGTEIIENGKISQEPSSRNIKSKDTGSILLKAQELAKAREKEEANKPRRPL